jgi:hypothetical protein
MKNNPTKPVTKTFLRSLKPLTKDDLQNEEKWYWAKLVVPSNIERHHLNTMQIKRWGIKHGEALLYWFCPLRNDISSSGRTLTRESYDATGIRSEPLVKEIPQLKMYFVRGAKCYITKGINPNVTGIVNGLSGRFHSLTWNCGYKFAPSKLIVGEENEVPIPYSVNVILDDGRIVPVTAVQRKVPIPKLTGFGMKKKIAFLGLFVDVGFAITFHKLQGQTVEKLILLLGQRPGSYL